MFFLLISIFILILWIIIGTTYLKLNPFLVLFLGSIFLCFFLGIPLYDIPKFLFTGFTETIEKIGLLIIFGTIIGATLELTNATSSIANYIINRFKNIPLQFKIGFIGYIISIPVFCDAAFIILSKTVKSISKKSNIPLKSLGVALSTGLFAPHVLVPPTPGPLAAASNLRLENFPLLIIIGGILAFILVIVGSSYSFLIFRKSKFDYNTLIIKEFANKNPNLYDSIMPIFIPVILMAMGTLLGNISALKNLDFIFSFLGNPSFALFVGVLLSFRLIRFSPKVKIKNCIKKGAFSAFPIILITGMGGTLGLIMQKIPLDEVINNYSFDFGVVLLIPFFMSSMFKTVQGSSTVAIITTSTILYPLLSSLGLNNEIDKIWTILSIGVGSMTVSHTNDSYFWIVSEMIGISVEKALKYHTTGTLIQGISGIVFILIGYKLTSLINFI
ncbi:MAG: GntP family permease [Flavobacteriaceae bacterium]|tara:strand:- start:33510 stop:34841 length:1332 start_codon:yes stop_codon:yes gene_type:complete